MLKIPIPSGYQEEIVTPRASRSLEAHWSFSATGSGHSLVLPDGRCDIIVRYNQYDAAPPLPIVTGPATRPYTVAFKAGDCWLGIRLRPHIGVSLWQQGIIGAADTVLKGEDAIALLPELARVNNRDLTITTLADLTSKLTTSDRTDMRLLAAFDMLHLSGGRIRVDSLSEKLSCTPRQLNRIFKANSGLTTKIHSQLVQFHRALKLLRAEQLPLSDAAFEGGYSDHAHLTRAFKRFGGFTPSSIPRDLTTPSLFS